MFSYAQNGNSEMWDWQGGDYCLQQDINLGEPYLLSISRISHGFWVNDVGWFLLLWAGIAQSLWDGVSQNYENVYMFDETTPVKACGDMAHRVADNGSFSVFYFLCHSKNTSFDLNRKWIAVDMNKELEHCGMMSSQLKGRRMLQFDNEVLDTPLCSEDISSVFLKSEVGVSFLFPCGSCYINVVTWCAKLQMLRVHLCCSIWNVIL